MAGVGKRNVHLPLVPQNWSLHSRSLHQYHYHTSYSAPDGSGEEGERLVHVTMDMPVLDLQCPGYDPILEDLGCTTQAASHRVHCTWEGQRDHGRAIEGRGDHGRVREGRGDHAAMQCTSSRGKVAVTNVSYEHVLEGCGLSTNFAVKIKPPRGQATLLNHSLRRKGVFPCRYLLSGGCSAIPS